MPPLSGLPCCGAGRILVPALVRSGNLAGSLSPTLPRTSTRGQSRGRGRLSILYSQEGKASPRCHDAGGVWFQPCHLRAGITPAHMGTRVLVLPTAQPATYHFGPQSYLLPSCTSYLLRVVVYLQLKASALLHECAGVARTGSTSMARVLGTVHQRQANSAQREGRTGLTQAGGGRLKGQP